MININIPQNEIIGSILINAEFKKGVEKLTFLKTDNTVFEIYSNHCSWLNWVFGRKRFYKNLINHTVIGFSSTNHTVEFVYDTGVVRILWLR